MLVILVYLFLDCVNFAQNLKLSSKLPDQYKFVKLLINYFLLFLVTSNVYLWISVKVSKDKGGQQENLK